MSAMFWIIVTIVGIVFFGWLIYEAYTAPVMPDDYGVEEQEKEASKTEFYNGDTDVWTNDNKWKKNK